MGIFSDLKANATSIDTSIPITALDRQVVREIDDWIARGDVDYPTALLARDEVQSILQYTSDPSAGDFTLAFTLKSGETFTTAAIAYDAVAATIETAIDVAATAASVVGWTNGDITVSGGTLLLAGATVVLTFDGTSVTNQNHAQTIFDGAGLTGGGVEADPDITTTVGQNNRTAWGALEAMGIVPTASIPDQGVSPVPFTRVTGPGDNQYYPSQATIRALADEASIDDANVVSKTEILAATNLPAQP